MTAFSIQNSSGVARNSSLEIYRENAVARQALESFIHERYAQVYGANVRHFLPWLLSLRENGVLRSALGLRPGGCEAFFVEHYLDSPLEALLSKAHGPVLRTQIIETGNLAAVSGSSPLLFSLLTEVLYRAGFRWITFTATTHVSNLLRRLGMRPEQICIADVNRLGDEAKHWGSYYDSKPSVLVGNLEGAYRTLQDNELAQKALQEYAGAIDAIVAILLNANTGVGDE